MRTQFVQDGLDEIVKMNVTGNGKRLDANESAFFERQLESIESRLYEKKLRELKFRKLIPVSNRDGAGALTITYYLYTPVGMAKIIANPSDDLPRSDVFASRHTASVRVIGTSFGYSTQELRHAQFANVSLEERKANAARRSIHEKENDIAWNGDAEYDLLGLLNNPNIPVDQVVQAAGGGNSRVWGVDKTAAEVAEDIADLQSGIVTDTKEVHVGNVLLLPIKKLRFLASTPMSATIPTMTILKWIKDPDNGFMIDEVHGLPELSASGPGATEQMLLYERDPDVLEARIPMEMQTLPPERRNLEFVIPVESENAGVVVRYPLACRFGYNI